MISFIVPIYKKPLAQVERSIKSLLDMSYSDIEVIASFDGPDAVLEGSVEAIAKKDKRVKKIVNDHGGACRARNNGFKESTGEIVCFWDADCYAMPEMAKTWLVYFDDKSKPNFLYSGYKWTDPRKEGYESEEFNPWLLNKYNYICSMSPLKRGIVLEWDENLEGLQDWDYFRRIVQSGAKGLYVPCGQNAVAAGFETEYPDENSISGVSSREKGVERIEAVRTKHGDPKCDLLVYGNVMKPDAVNVAMHLDADYYNSAFWVTHEYKGVILVGFNPFEMDSALQFAAVAGEKSRKIIYWMGLDADMLAQGPYVEVKKLSEGIKKHIHVNLCADVRTKNTLEEIGVSSEIVPLPLAKGRVLTSMPETFRVLSFSDNECMPLADSIIKAMPDVEFDKYDAGKSYPYDKYSMVLYLVKDGRMMTPAKNMLIHGRHMVSNVQEAYAGFIEVSDITKFKDAAISRIREVQATNTLNSEAQDYYLEVMSVDKFKAAINSYVNALEVVNA